MNIFYTEEQPRTAWAWQGGAPVGPRGHSQELLFLTVLTLGLVGLGRLSLTSGATPLPQGLLPLLEEVKCGGQSLRLS